MTFYIYLLCTHQKVYEIQVLANADINRDSKNELGTGYYIIEPSRL